VDLVVLESKICNMCRKLKNLTEFDRDKRSKTALLRMCRECKTRYNLLWKYKNHDKYKHYKKKQRIKYALELQNHKEEN